MKYWPTLGYSKFDFWPKNDIESSLYALKGLQPAVAQKSNEQEQRKIIKKPKSHDHIKIQNLSGENRFKRILKWP